jgi:ribose transport system substrate-binding protein
MRKIAWLVALLVLVPFVVGFAAPKVKVGVVYVTFSSPYASAMVKGYQKFAKEMNIDMTILDSQLDIQKEAANMDSIIAMKPDVIIIAPVDGEGSKAAIKKAIAKKIPVICSNVTVNDAAKIGVLAFTGPNCYSEAEVVAREAIRRNPTGRVVMITGTPGYSAAEDRKNGFLDTVMRVAPNMKILDIQSGNWMRDETQRVMSDFITKYGDQIDIVYTHDDNMTVGAINALKDAGYTATKRPIVLSIGAMADGLPAVQDGWIDATCQQSPWEDARLSLQVALDIKSGKFKGPFKNFWIDTPPVDKNNVQKVIDMHIWD